MDASLGLRESMEDPHRQLAGRGWQRASLEDGANVGIGPMRVNSAVTRVPVSVPMVMRGIVSMVVRVGMPMSMDGGRAGDEVSAMGACDAEPCARESLDAGAGGVEVDRTGSQRVEMGLDRSAVGAQIKERAEDHVPAGAAGEVEAEYAHVLSPVRLIMAAATPAPNPLSMFTTVMPGTHELSIAIRVVRPPRLTP